MNRYTRMGVLVRGWRTQIVYIQVYGELIRSCFTLSLVIRALSSGPIINRTRAGATLSALAGSKWSPWLSITKFNRIVKYCSTLQFGRDNGPEGGSWSFIQQVQQTTCLVLHTDSTSIGFYGSDRISLSFRVIPPLFFDALVLCVAYQDEGGVNFLKWGCPNTSAPWGAWKLSVVSFQFCNSRCQGLTLTPTGIIHFLLACLIDIITGKMKRKIWPLRWELNSSLLMHFLTPSPLNHKGPG